ncbi:MAG TPA: DUF4954 domain-containing protein, partial [Flavisolibacter sp.]
NNSFLIAATVMGQSNIAAGATLGSNHNSRAADGELVTGRGFWPGLCVSLKHNSRFATFTLLAKGDFPAELNIPMPFCLVSNDVTNNKLVIMPAYWFMYNQYALTRNSFKYADRDKRTKKLQHIEYNFLAPDSVNEVFTALDLLRKYTAVAARPELNREKDAVVLQEGERLLNDKSVDVSKLNVYAEGFECTNRPTQIIKVKEAYTIYKKLVIFYALELMCLLIERDAIRSFEDLQQALPKDTERRPWINIGGQLFPQASLQSLLTDIKKGKINSWNEVHSFYGDCSKAYPAQKLQHAYASLLEILQIKPAAFTCELFLSLLKEALDFKTEMVEGIYISRAKDYQNEFRKMVYDNQEEMAEVVGRLEENNFIKQQQAELERFRSFVTKTQQKFTLQTA